MRGRFRFRVLCCLRSLPGNKRTDGEGKDGGREGNAAAGKQKTAAEKDKTAAGKEMRLQENKILRQRRKDGGR